MPKPNTSGDGRKTTGVLHRRNYCKPTEETEAPGRWRDLSELHSASGKLRNFKSDTLNCIFLWKLTAFGKKTAAKPSWRVKSVRSRSEHSFRKAQSPASQNFSNWPKAPLLMLPLWCVHAQSLLEIHTVCYQRPCHSNYAFGLEAGSNSSVQYPSEADVPCCQPKQRSSCSALLQKAPQISHDGSV